MLWYNCYVKEPNWGKRRRPFGRNRMKRKTLGSHGRGKRKAVKYTDEYIEDFYEDEDPAGQDDAGDDIDSGDDEYIVAYSSESNEFYEYTSEQMQEYAEEYEEALAYEGPEEYGEPEAYEEPEEYGEQEEYVEEQEEYGGLETYEELEEYGDPGAYEEPEEYEESELYEEPGEYDGEYEDSEEYTQEFDELGEYDGGYEDSGEYDEEYEEPGEYTQEYEKPQEYGGTEGDNGPGRDEDPFATVKIDIEIYDPAKDESLYGTGERTLDETEDIYEDGSAEYYVSDEYSDDAYINEYVNEEYDEEVYDSEEEYYNDEYIEEEYDEDSYDVSYDEFDDYYESDAMLFDEDEGEESPDLWQRIKMRLGNLTAFDAVLASTGVVVLVAAFVMLSMFLQSRQINKQIEALAPLGSELKEVGIAGGDGLLAMADAALAGNFAQTADQEEASSEDTLPGTASVPDSGRVNVDFVSVEKDLKIRFTDVYTGELITGTVFEVTLTNAKGKQLVLTDDDMDGIIYAQNVNAGVFDAVITSTDKYKFPTVAQQVTVKDKVEYLVINVQDEVKTEKQVNVAAEDTEKNVAAVEAEVLKDTVEWVESTKTPISGTESYLLVDKNTIADPSKVSKAAARMLFDTLNVTLEPASATLNVGSSIDLKGSEFANKTEGDIEYQYTTEWKSSNDGVASVSGGKVTAKTAGEAVITYTVTRKTITTTYEKKDPVVETVKISVEEYEKLSDAAEKEKYKPITDEAGAVTGYGYEKSTEQEPEKKTSETTESASAECKVTVEPAKITSGSLELTRSADSCAVGATLTVKPSKLVYTKQDGSTETLTGNFPSIAWESADKAIATVGTDGVVTGVKPGKVHITGRVTGVSGADGKELDIRCSVEISVTEAADLAIALDRTGDVYLAVGGSTTLVATVSNYKSDAGVTWETSDKKVATVDEKGVVTGVAAGSVKITATTKEKDKGGNQKQATCVVTINSNATSDTTTKLKDKSGNQIYIKNPDGSYREAVYADYFSSTEFYISAQANYVYTGWQTIEGKTYYYDKNGKAVTGTQIIQGVTYNFGEDGAIATKVNGSTFGIDVSRHNGTIDWSAVKASGVDYVIIRCGYRGSSTGALIEDQNFRTNIKGATAAGLKVGVYVFSQAVDEVEAVKEASLAVSLVKGYNLTYPIFIDTEASGGRADKIDKATRTAVVNAFCQTVASAGYQPGIYASKTWFEDKLNMGGVGSCRIWLAQYSAAPTYSGKYDLWQYSSKGKISGIKTDVDLNYSYTGY